MIITNERNRHRIGNAVAIAVADAVKGTATLWLVSDPAIGQTVWTLIGIACEMYNADAKLITVRVLG